MNEWDEYKKLRESINDIKDVLKDEKELFDLFFKKTQDNNEDLWQMVDLKKVKIKALESSLDNPYFARIDFIFKDTGKKESVYIGKNGIIKNNEVIVTDWRAPISALYYDSEIGDCEFNSPVGVIAGTISLKRQFEIEKGKLTNYFDVDLVANDALLQRYLDSNNDARLKSIVATIQKEQNMIIRKNLNHNLIVQGVAGSGKTTVALHRIAYLVYNYIKFISQREYLIIGPNPVFLKYIKSVLPDLDVSSVSQYIYEDLVKNYLGESIIISDSIQKLTQYIDNHICLSVESFKSSLKYKNMIDLFIEDYLDCLVSDPIFLGDLVLYSSNELKEELIIAKSSAYPTLKSKIDLLIERLSKNIIRNKTKYILKYNEVYESKFANATLSQKEALRMRMNKDKKAIEKGCRDIIRNYFNKKNMSCLKLYRLFIENIANYDVHDYSDLENLRAQTLKNIKKKIYEYEDLPALMYLQIFLKGNERFAKMRQVVIDEAQDYGEFAFVTLKKCFPEATFSIFGDLAQSIYDYRGIENWSFLQQFVFDDAEIIYFNKSYRTTAEIMQVADKVAMNIGMPASEMVIRHGNEVKYTNVNGIDKYKYIKESVDKFIAKGFKSIAIISKSDHISKIVNQKLIERGLLINNVTYNDDLSHPKFQICSISNYLAKGLEFDAVIIADASENVYSSASRLDMKLLYVAITRALHEVDILYDGQITKVLEN